MFRNLSTVGLPLSGRSSELIELALSFGFERDGHRHRRFPAAGGGLRCHARPPADGERHGFKSGVFHLPVALGWR